MAWWRDPVWQEGVAIVSVVAGAVLVYLGAADSGELRGAAPWGAVLFVAGVLLPGLRELRASRRGCDPERGDLD